MAVRNIQLQTFRFEHTEGVATLFAEFASPRTASSQADGLLARDTGTVFVTMTPLPGQYGFTVGRAHLVFSSSDSPTVRISHAAYGDLSVHDSTTRYPTPADYSAALAIWHARESDTVVASALDAPATHLLTA